MSFTDVVGQEQAINLLNKSFISGRLYQSYLFSGPDGVGKQLAAKNFAKLLNCKKPESGPCDRCSSCIKIDNNNHPDIYFIHKDKSGFISIDTIREMQRYVNLKPFEALHKVFIIDCAHCLSAEAQGALLKTIEEPSGNSIIILITSNLGRIFPTIISRCQKINFSVLGQDALKGFLKQKYRLSNFEAHFLAYFSGGRFQVALGYKDRQIMDEKNRIIDAVLNRQPGRIEKLLIDSKDKDRMKDCFQILLGLFRDVLFIKAGSSSDMLINIDRESDLLSLKERFSFRYLEEMISDIQNLNLYLEQNINPKFFLSWLSSRI